MLMLRRSWSHSKSSGKKGPTAKSVMVIHCCYMLCVITCGYGSREISEENAWLEARETG